ncbi:MAG: pilus assembly protein [Thermodesulfobacteriota bacterium]
MFTRLDFFKDCRSGGIWGRDQGGGRSGIFLRPRLQIASEPVLSSEPVELPKEWCSYRIVGIIGRIYEQIRSVISNPVLSRRPEPFDAQGKLREGTGEGAVRNLKRLIRYHLSTRFSLLATRLRALACTLIMTVCFASLAMTLLFVTGAYGDPIIKNELEDLNILISQVIGGAPDVLIVYDNSLSMGDNFGLSQLGIWHTDAVITRCESYQNVNTNYAKAHCIGNASGTTPCGSTACSGSISGTCERPEDFERFLQCIESPVKPVTLQPGWYADPNGDGSTSDSLVTTIYNTVVTNACGGSSNNPRTECTNDTERAHAAAAIENQALKQANAGNSANFPLNCGASNCTGDADKSCCDVATNPTCINPDSEYTTFKNCMNSLSIQPTSTTCANGKLCSKGIFGTTRMDVTLSALFDFLDADDSLATKFCVDQNRLFDGTSTSIDCEKFMNTPFRNVGSIAEGGSSLPITNGAETKLIDEFTAEDIDLLGIKFGGMRFAGSESSITSCTDTKKDFNISGDTFTNVNVQAIKNQWKYLNQRHAGGRSPLALAMGFDDSIPGTVKDDAIFAFQRELARDPATSCSGEFVILITDGEDTCSGECAALPGSCTGNPQVTGNANRRSSIQAASNLRTFYARNPVNNTSVGSIKKEIMTFIIAIGVKDPKGVRTLNSMALTGGTHTTGIIKHVDPSGNVIGDVKIDSDPLFSGLPQVFRNLGKALGIDSNPSNAHLQNCLIPNENTGVCSFQGTNVFDNTFFSTSGPLDSTISGQSFAFFVNTPEELAAALGGIKNIVQTFSTSGVSPVAPQSVGQFTFRDRAVVSILTPITDDRLWQGRLALYGFIEDPNNPGAKIIVDKDREEIFNVNGALDPDATDFFWESGKLLAEGDPDSRTLFSVKTTPSNPAPGELDPSTVDIFTSGTEVVGIRYKGERATFNTTLPPELFGISDADVTDPIPAFCTSTCDPATTCSVVTDPACLTCVKDCIRDKVVNFMRGDTGIETVADPMGLPTTESQSDDSMGFSCPDPDNPGTGSLDTCSVRLGPVFHASPIIVGSPSPIFFDVGFQNFAREFRDRTGVVYAAANDGFIHAFNAGDFVDTTDSSLTDAQKTNPFTGEVETIPFFTAGDGTELFGFAPPSFLPDSLAPTNPDKDPESPSGITPDYRFGDFKTFVVDNQLERERSFTDGGPLIADLFVDGEQNGIQDNASCSSNPGLDGVIDTCGKEWHTVLLAGYRNGGGAYTALDVTNVDRTQTDLKKLTNGPDYPRHLWTVFDKNFGNTWSEPTIGRVKMMTKNANGDDVIVDRWVMFVGGGLDPLDTDPRDTTPAGVNFGNAFYVIDVTTGKIIYKLAKEPTSDPASAPNATDTDPRMVCEMSSKVGAFDYNADGFIDVVFDGDTCGRLWRIDVSEEIDGGADISKTGLRGDANITTPNWTADIAFCATADFTQCENPSLIPLDPVTGISQRQPIFFAPTAVLDDLGRRHVIFVTGNRRHPSSAGDFGKLYNFIDNFVPSFLGGGTAVTTKTEADFTTDEIIDLVPQGGFADQFTTSGGTGVQGEFIVRFPSNIPTPAGEKGFGSPVVINSVLVFTTFFPGGISVNACSGGTGEGRVFALDYLTGEPALARIPGALGLIQGNASEQALSAGLTAAEGMPTPPQLTFGPSGNVVFTVAFTGSAAIGGSTFLVWEFAKLPANTSTLFWEEIF